MLWSTLSAQIRRELEEPSEAIFSEDSLLFWANESARDIATRAKCIRDWLTAACVVGQEEYAVPSGSLEVIAVFCGSDTDDNRRRLMRQEVTEWGSLDVANGRPAYYAIDDAYIYLRPAPDAAYELAFQRYALPTEMAEDTDTVPFDARYNTALSYYIRAKAMEQISDWQAADALLGRYNAEVDKIITQEGHQANAARSTSVTSVY